MMSVSYEQSKNEKHSLHNEILKGREELEKYAEKVKSLQDAQQLGDTLERYKVVIQALKDDISTLKGTIDLRDRKIDALERELEIAHRTMNVQEKFEGKLKSHAHHFQHPHSQTGLLDMDVSTAHYNREAMRSLYYELGKRQTDMHSLAISLSDAQKEKEDCKAQIASVTAQKDATAAENRKLRETIEELNKDKEELRKEIDSLHQLIHSQEEYHQRLKAQTEEVSKRHSEMNYLHEEMMNEKNSEILQVLDLLEQNERIRNELQVKYDTMQNTMDYIDNSHKLDLQRSAKEVEKCEEEIQSLRELQSEHELTVAQLNKVRQSLQTANVKLDAQEHQIGALRAEIQNYEQKVIPALEYNLSNSHAQLLNNEKEIRHLHTLESQIVNERNEAIEALKQTITVTRDVSAKHQRERELRYNAEKTVASLQKAKENVSSAVLEALQLERQKSALYERMLQEATQSHPPAHHSVGRGSVSVSQSHSSLPPPHPSSHQHSRQPVSLSISAGGSSGAAAASAAATASAVQGALSSARNNTSSNSNSANRPAPQSYLDYEGVASNVVYQPVSINHLLGHTPASTSDSIYSQNYNLAPAGPAEMRDDSLDSSTHSLGSAPAHRPTIVATLKTEAETMVVTNAEEESHPYSMVSELQK